MTPSREADRLLPPRMTPFTGLFQRPQCDPEPLTFPVHSQSPPDTPLIKKVPPVSFGPTLLSTAEEMLALGGISPTQSSRREHIPPLPAVGLCSEDGSGLEGDGKPQNSGN